MLRFLASLSLLFLLCGSKPLNTINNQKTVKVSSCGSGHTLEEARSNALQVVSGSYVSSNIVVEIDVIIRNNINVFTSGSIKSAKILSK